MTKCLYVAGPMSNLPQFNFPLFETVAVALRADGYTIVSPHECDAEETRAAAWASPDGKVHTGMETWGDCLGRDVRMLADGLSVGTHTENTGELLKIDGIAFLPNWEKSRGARLEAFVGLLTEKEFYTVDILTGGVMVGSDDIGVTPVTTEWVQHMLAAPWAEAIKMHTPL